MSGLGGLNKSAQGVVVGLVATGGYLYQLRAVFQSARD